MTLVLVHGNPEASAIWDPLVDELRRDDVIRVSLPGFGAPIPPGFACTITGYRDFLASAIESLDGPVDLVGHDVGGSTTIALAMTRPDLLTSWASDSIGVFDPGYEWHPLARGWQTPGVGEASVAEWTGGDEDQRLALAAGLGATGSVAAALADALNADMGRAILQFYRSAAQPAMARLGESLEQAAARPGLALIPTADTFVGSVESRHSSAARAGATAIELPGLGHRWMLDDPALSARALESFWDGLAA
ncbi:alpha/beta fold hydrolase [Frondihabitans cladoniiphilus]|uniref:Alpha/beta fold hydrolase n=1 Tax=Frondihabitans cladoniiphilus TaxID=715785 RepID=A0ABP8VWM9_9MICO